MSTELVEKEIARFLASPDAEVLCLRGKWGVGKTYSWNEFLKQAQRQKRVALKSYSYVSLFGLESLDQLKYAIFENSVGTDSVGVEPSLDTLRTNTASVASRLGRKSWSVLQHLPKVKDFAAAVQSLSFLSVRNTIICIDDLERKGGHLPTKDVLGLISQLKDQRKCKVALILNADELEERDQEEFEKYGEKVIDVSLEFEPSPSDSARIAITGTSAGHTLTSANCVALGIANIRIIKKIERLVLQIQSLLAEFDEHVLKQAAQSLALLGWAVHSGNTALLEFVMKKRGKSWYGSTREEDLTNDEKTWDALLDEFGFRSMDEFDLVLLSGIKSGFYDEERLKRAGAELDKRVKALAGENSLEAAWRLYHDSFDDNRDRVLKAIADAFVEQVQFVTPVNLDGTVRFFKDLGEADAAQEAIDYYMSERKEDKEFFDLAGSPFQILDEDVRKAFAAKFDSFKDERNPGEVPIRIAKEHGWGREDITLLSSLSVDDFCKLFKSERGTDLTRVIQASLQFGRLHNADQQLQQIAARAEEALTRIGREFDINRRRVGKYGIKIEE